MHDRDDMRIEMLVKPRDSLRLETLDCKHDRRRRIRLTVQYHLHRKVKGGILQPAADCLTIAVEQQHFAVGLEVAANQLAELGLEGCIRWAKGAGCLVEGEDNEALYCWQVDLTRGEGRKWW